MKREKNSLLASEAGNDNHFRERVNLLGFFQYLDTRYGVEFEVDKKKIVIVGIETGEHLVPVCFVQRLITDEIKKILKEVAYLDFVVNNKYFGLFIEHLLYPALQIEL